MNRAKELFEDLISKATPVPLGYANLCFHTRRKDQIAHFIAKYIKHDKRVISFSTGLYIYNSGYYKKINNEEYLKKIAAELLQYAGVIPKSQFLNETVKLLNPYCLIDDKELNPGNSHNASNAVLRLNFNDGSISLEKHSPLNYHSYQAEAEYLPDFDTALAEDFLKKIIPDVNQRIISLETTGFALFLDLRKKFEFTKVTLEYGEGSNGKTIYTNLRRRIIGHEVCSSVPIDLIIGKDNRFIASTLYKKKANCSTESESSFIRESSILNRLHLVSQVMNCL